MLTWLSVLSDRSGLWFGSVLVVNLFSHIYHIYRWAGRSNLRDARCMCVCVCMCGHCLKRAKLQLPVGSCIFVCVSVTLARGVASPRTHTLTLSHTHTHLPKKFQARVCVCVWAIVVCFSCCC